MDPGSRDTMLDSQFREWILLKPSLKVSLETITCLILPTPPRCHGGSSSSKDCERFYPMNVSFSCHWWITCQIIKDGEHDMSLEIGCIWWHIWLLPIWRLWHESLQCLQSLVFPSICLCLSIYAYIYNISTECVPIYICRFLRFPEIGVPPNHPFLDGIFNCKPTIFFLDIPIYGTSHIDICCNIHTHIVPIQIVSMKVHLAENIRNAVTASPLISHASEPRLARMAVVQKSLSKWSVYIYIYIHIYITSYHRYIYIHLYIHIWIYTYHIYIYIYIYKYIYILM